MTLAAVDEQRLFLRTDRLSLPKLQRELRAIAIRHDHLLRKEETRKWKLLGKEGKARARRC